MLYLPGTSVDWNYTTVQGPSTQCQENKVYKVIRGKTLGGTSGLNYMLYIRGSQEVYDFWANITKDNSWRYENILPYFKKSERLEDLQVLQSESRNFHGTEGYLGVTKQNNVKAVPILQAFQEVGQNVILDFNGNNSIGFGQVMLTLSEGVRQSTAQSFLTPILDRRNLYVIKRALVTKILFDKNKNAIGVELTDENNKDLRVKANKEIIVSGGAINSPQLLMLSGIGPKNHLKRFKIPVISDLPVGKNLQDHICVMLMHTLNEDNSNSSNRFNPHEFSLSIVVGFTSLNNNQHRDYQGNYIIGDAEQAMQTCSYLFSFDQDICQRLYDKSKGKRVFFTSLYNVAPKTRGEILLQSRNPKHPPLIDLKAFSHNDDLDNMVKYIKNYMEIENSTYFKSNGAKFLQLDCLKDLPVGSDEYWRRYALCMSSSGYHYAGSCAMGAVLDSRLRVHGVGRLRVVDASAMPVISDANPNPTVIMMAEKAADMIKQDDK